jgi:hypothetical protein
VQAMFLRYQARVTLYAGFLQEEYPPFSYDTASADPGDVSRLRVELQPELQNRNRVTVGFRLILVIPQAIVLLALWIAAVVIFIIGFFAVLFTGRGHADLRAQRDPLPTPVRGVPLPTDRPVSAVRPELRPAPLTGRAGRDPSASS